MNKKEFIFVTILLCLFSFLLLLSYIDYSADYFYDKFGFIFSMVLIPIAVVQIPASLFLVSTGKKLKRRQRYLFLIIPNSIMLFIAVSFYLMLQAEGF